MTRLLLCAGLLLLTTPDRVLAQEICGPEAGIRLRFAHLDPPRSENRLQRLFEPDVRVYDDAALVKLEPDTLRALVNGSEAAFELSEVEDLEMECSRDPGAGARTGLWQGALAGGLLGFIWAWCDPELFIGTGKFCHYGLETSDAWGRTAGGAALGGALGAVLGAAFGGQRWVPVPNVGLKGGGRGEDIWTVAVRFGAG